LAGRRCASRTPEALRAQAIEQLSGLAQQVDREHGFSSQAKENRRAVEAHAGENSVRAGKEETSGGRQFLRLRQKSVQEAAALRAKNPDGPRLRFTPDGKPLRNDDLALGREMQATAAPPCRWIHGEEAVLQPAFEIARQRRLLDVECMPNLHSRNAVLLRELRQERELAGGDAKRTQGVVVHPGDDAAELADARRYAG